MDYLVVHASNYYDKWTLERQGFIRFALTNHRILLSLDYHRECTVKTSH